MADIKASAGGAYQLRGAMYRDDGDGTHTESFAANLWVYNDTTLAWERLSISDLLAPVDTTAIYESGTALTPKRAFANVAAGQTDSSIVAAVSQKKIRVISVAMVSGATATNVTFNTKPGGAGSAVSPLFANAANSGVVLPVNQWGWFQTSTGEGLTVTTGAGSTTGILVGYLEVS